jgi:uncharacterized protein involved in response to NO
VSDRGIDPGMIIVGIILVFIGAVANVPILYSLGAILAIIGIALWILGATGTRCTHA